MMVLFIGIFLGSEKKVGAPCGTTVRPMFSIASRSAARNSGVPGLALPFFTVHRKHHARLRLLTRFTVLC